MERRFHLIVLLSLVSVVKGLDPCSSYLPFPDEERRSHTYKLKPGEVSVADYFIDDSKETWYGTEGYDLYNAAPGYGLCGGKTPIWVKDPANRFTSGTRSLTVCMQNPANDCEDSWKISVHGCGTYRVYKLVKTSFPESVYCTGPTDPGKPPSKENLTKPPVISIGMDEGVYPVPLRISCTPQETLRTDLFYQTYWFVNDQKVYSSPVLKGTSGYHQNSILREEDIPSEIIGNTGFNVKCAIRIRDTYGGTPGLPISSDSKFAGIQILNTNIEVNESGEAKVRMVSTVPIKCYGSAGRCQLYVEVDASVTTTDQCQPEATFPSCGAIIHRANDETSITVTSQLMLDYGLFSTTATFELKTKTNDIRFFKNHSAGKVTVKITKNKFLSEGKECHALVDPHMLTFDGRYYEHQYYGNFTLYKHKQHPVEVQMKTDICNTGISTKVYCISALAIRSDTRVLRFKHTGNRWLIKFANCKGNGEMQDMDIEKLQDGMIYKVSLPTGARITIDILGKIPKYDARYSKFLNVYIYPGPDDVGQSEGLCGTLTDKCKDDFELRNGGIRDNHATCVCRDAVTRKGDSFPEFSESWRVLPDEDLFQDKIVQNLKPWSSSGNGQTYCSCLNATDAGGHLSKHVTCKADRGKSCFKDQRYKKWIINSRCVDTNMARKRRSVPILPSARKRLISKRQAIPPPQNNTWTETTAKEHCQQLFKRSSAIQKCAAVEGVDVTASLENCVLDIMMSGVDAFSMSALESVKTRCLHEVAMNATVEAASKGTGEQHKNTSIFAEVFALSCVNECSFRGMCRDGICKCDEGFGAADCSVDINAAPETYGLDSDGYCDLIDGPCNVTSVYTEYVVDTNITSCRLQHYTIDDNGTLTEGDTHYVRPLVESFSEAVCSLPVTRERRSVGITINTDPLIQGYKVSISNNGKNFSDVHMMVVFDSTCQDCVIGLKSVQCKFTEVACLSDGICVPAGMSHPRDQCYVCDVAEGVRTWKKSQEATCVAIAETEISEQKLWIIGAVLGPIAVVLVLITIIWVRFNKSNAKVSDSRFGLQDAGIDQK